jgi:hypothetical protein
MNEYILPGGKYPEMEVVIPKQKNPFDVLIEIGRMTRELNLLFEQDIDNKKKRRERMSDLN